MQNGKERKINIAELVNCDIIINRRYKMNEIERRRLKADNTICDFEL